MMSLSASPPIRLEDSGFYSTRFVGPRTPNTASGPRSYEVGRQRSNLPPPFTSFQPPLSPSLCQCLLPLIFLNFFSFPAPLQYKTTMVLVTALLLSLVFLASLANILSRVPPKKLPLLLLLRTLFAEPPIPPPASSTPGKLGGPPPLQQKEGRPAMSAERRTELRRVFATFDRNGDVLITREELRESLRGLRISVSDAEVEEAVTGSDANGDGRIDLDEFCGLMESISAVGKAVGDCSGGDGEQGGDAELKEAFDVFDRDGDGVITVEELGRVLSSLGMSEGKRAEACEEMIRKVDVDGDGMVNFDEFKRMMRGGQTLLVSAY